MSENSTSSSRRRPTSSSPASSTSFGDPAYDMSPSTSSHHFSGGPSTPNNNIYAPRPSTPEEPSGGKKHKKNVSFSREADYCHDSPTLGTAWSPNPSKGSLDANRETASWSPSSHPQATYAGIAYNPPDSPTPAPTRTSDHSTLLHPPAQHQASPQSPYISSFSSSSYSNNASTSKLPPTPMFNHNRQLPDVHTPISTAHHLPTSPVSSRSSLSKQTPISQAPEQSPSPHEDVELAALLLVRDSHPLISFDVRDRPQDVRVTFGDRSFNKNLADTPAFSPGRRSMTLRLTTPSGDRVDLVIGDDKGDEIRELTVGFVLDSLCGFLRQRPQAGQALSDATTTAFQERISRAAELYPSRYEEEWKKGPRNVDFLGRSFTWLGLQPAKDLVMGEVVWDLRLA